MNITLPELPPADTHCFDDDAQRDVWTHSPEQMRAYATAAIEADRAARGEPVAWANNDEPPMLFWDKTEALKHVDGEADLLPLCRCLK